VSCHDVSAGGLAQALLEMSFASGRHLGFEVARKSGWDDAGWFSEEPGFVLEVPAESLADVRRAITVANLVAFDLGTVSADRMVVDGVALDRPGLESLWSSALEEAFEVSEEVLS